MYKILKGKDPFIIDGDLPNIEKERINCSETKPYKIAVLNWDSEGGEKIGINCLVEITQPFTRYYSDEYDATDFIEFENRSFYCCWATPMESQSIDKAGDFDDWDISDKDRVELDKWLHHIKSIKVDEIII